jgi:hypothetical protein
MTLFKTLIVAAAAAILLLLVSTVRAEEFKALPGLWKTTSQIENATSVVSAQIKWHCVDEDDDPWIAFAHLDVLPQESCKRVGFSRTSTSLKWSLDCTGAFAMTNEGSVVFDGAQHYSGKVKLTGTMMGYPIDETIHVEGEHRAACTSAAD